MRIKTFIPLLIFLPMIIFLWKGLRFDPHLIPSPLIGKPVPHFQGKTILTPEKNIDQTIFLGHLSLLSIFATWCTTCIAEQSALMHVHHQFPNVFMIGLSFKDQKNKVADWLKKYGNPYQVIMNDPNGKIGIDFGVYGTPESFLIDQQGVVRYKIVGIIDPKNLSAMIQKITH